MSLAAAAKQEGICMTNKVIKKANCAETKEVSLTSAARQWCHHVLRHNTTNEEPQICHCGEN